MLIKIRRTSCESSSLTLSGFLKGDKKLPAVKETSWEYGHSNESLLRQQLLSHKAAAHEKRRLKLLIIQSAHLKSKG